MEEKLPEFPPEKLPHTQSFPLLEKDHDESFVLLSHSEEPEEASSNKELFQGIFPKKRIMSVGGSGLAGGCGGGQPTSMGPLINLFALFHILSSVLGLLNILLPMDLIGKLTGLGGTGGASHSFGISNTRPSYQDMESLSNYYKKYHE